MIHKFNNVMKMVTNRSTMPVCLDCMKMFVGVSAPECPSCGSSSGIPFNQLPHHDQDHILQNQ